MNNIIATIKGIQYTPFLGRKLNTYNLTDLEKEILKEATFILEIDEQNRVALSWWVSPKRTRSYPYARVYDSLSFTGKKITIIPVVKDEGKDGDRDFLQWDTVSLMSLLGIYVIIAYYCDAIKSSRYDNKITKQKFDIDYLKNQLKGLLSYQSDALHWNLSQLENIKEIAEKAKKAYDDISERLKVQMHSQESFEERINALKEGKNEFINLSRNLAKEAQKRESFTIQPKEKVEGAKGIITITNYLGGNYYFTCDEIEIKGKNILLIEAKHTKASKLPSLEDIKDGLIKMILFSNLTNVKIGDSEFEPIPILKLTTGEGTLKVDNKTKKLLDLLKEESKENKFKVLINSRCLNYFF